MRSNEGSVLIITVGEVDNVEDVKERIADIRGVTATEYSYLTHKLQVRFQGNQARLQEIDLEIKRLLQGKNRVRQ